MSVPGRAGYHLEIYDGKTFRTDAEMGSEWQAENLRALVQTSSGDLWLGSASGGGILHNNVKREIFRAQGGYADYGVFVIFPLPSGKMLAGGSDALFEVGGKSWTKI